MEMQEEKEQEFELEERRLQAARKRSDTALQRSKEKDEERDVRLKRMRENTAQQRSQEEDEQRDVRLRQKRDNARNVRAKYIHQNIAKRCTINITGDQAFSNYLLDVGNGRHPILNDLGEFRTRIPEEFISKEKGLRNFCRSVFGNLENNYQNGQWLASRAIICPTNSEVDRVNELILKEFPGEEQMYKSCDSVQENAHQYPLEFINRLTPSGMPPHRLLLKKHCCIMLLRNLDSVNGHTNGTRYIVNSLQPHLIEATVAYGPHAGKKLFIPRIPFIPMENTFPFTMKRVQFPVRPGFAITSNKSQGQTLEMVGILLQRQFFSHGQYYVAQSRVGSSQSLQILVDDNSHTADNVVYPEVL
jgi:ATP-dependent DNA helicase PIF1